MPAYKRKTDYFETEEGIEIIEMLSTMNTDKAYNTEPSYSSNTKLYPNNLIPFVEKHMDYLRNHPSTDPTHYISNLRLMTRLR
ncbi:MAG TPA: hypothetical protein VLF87_01845 [Patescibacteria group bacterium]|nr:hypothetical protein [Patescibacteria group bacterium]